MVEQSYLGPEKRRHERLNRRYVVTILPEDGHSQPWEIVDLENISEDGILFNHNEKLEKGAILNLKIKILQDKNALQCAGRVIHVQMLGELELYEYGIGFIDVKPDDLILLRQSLES